MIEDDAKLIELMKEEAQVEQRRRLLEIFFLEGMGLPTLGDLIREEIPAAKIKWDNELRELEHE